MFGLRKAAASFPQEYNSVSAAAQQQKHVFAEYNNIHVNRTQQEEKKKKNTNYVHSCVRLKPGSSLRSVPAGLKVAGHGGSGNTVNRLKPAAARRELQAGRKSEPPRGNRMKNSLI